MCYLHVFVTFIIPSLEERLGIGVNVNEFIVLKYMHLLRKVATLTPIQAGSGYYKKRLAN